MVWAIKKQRFSLTREQLHFFVAGVTARTAAELVGIHRNSVNLFYHKLRTIIVYFTDLESPFLHGEVEVDESYFGGVRKGKRGRGAAGKIPVFGCLERKGKVYTQTISDVREKTLMPIIRSKAFAEKFYTLLWGEIFTLHFSRPLVRCNRFS